MFIDQLPDSVSCLFLDMNGTFMFGHDRLDSTQDFYTTYRNHGGTGDDTVFVNRSVQHVIHRLDTLYRSGLHDTAFPRVVDVARNVLGDDVSDDDILAIEKTIAAHETGSVSELNVQTLRKLSERFRLFVVSNLWSQSDSWKQLLQHRLGTTTLSGCVFSSDIGSIKPAREFFEYALKIAGVRPSEAVMIGDDMDRDIRPAAELGMTTVWVTATQTADAFASYQVSEISKLLE